MLLLSRRGENLLVTLIIPLALLFFFGRVVPPPGAESTTDFLVPGILALSVLSTSLVSLGISTAYERSYGVLKRLLGSPLRVRDLLLAKTLSVLAIEGVQVLLVVASAVLVLGWQPSGSLPLLLLALALGSAAFAGLGLLLAGTLRAEGTLALANGLYLFFLLTGGFVVPVSVLPEPLGTLARFLPAAALAEATRAALAPSANPFGPMLVLGAWALVLGGLAARLFRAD